MMMLLLLQNIQYTICTGALLNLGRQAEALPSGADHEDRDEYLHSVVLPAIILLAVVTHQVCQT